jgi:type IV secretory pathway VirB6-like protein
MQGYFLEQARTVAMICFALSLGISCVKMAMGGSELNKELTKTFMAVVTYFILIWAFPLIMYHMNKIVSELAYGATIGQGIGKVGSYDGKYGSAEGFYKYLNEIGQVGSNSLWMVRGDPGSPQKVFQFNITYVDTGLISVNKVFQIVLVTFKAMWTSLNVKNLFDFFAHIGDVVLIILIALVYVWALVMAIIQYAMTMVQFMFLYSVGVVFIPMSLWEGSKHAFESLVGSIFKIGIRILIVMITLYLTVLGTVDILKNMYILSGGSLDVQQRLEFYISIFFMSVFFKLFVDQAPSIADFLSGGSPRLSFGEFAQAAASVGAGAAMAATAGKGIVSGAAKTALGAGSAAVGGAQSAMGAAAAERGAGTGVGGQIGAGLQAFGSSIGQSALQGAGGVIDKGISNAGTNAQSLASHMRYGLSPTGPISQEGIGRAPRPPGLGGRGGGGEDEGSKSTSGGEEKNQKESERLFKSNSMSERMGGMTARYNELRKEGDQYSGLSGRVRAIRSSIGAYHEANRDKAPGSFKMSPALQQKMKKSETEANAGAGI